MQTRAPNTISPDVESQQCSRKSEHRRLCLSPNACTGSTGLEHYPLAYNALFSGNLDELDISCELFGKKLDYPLIIASMSGGSRDCAAFNVCLRRCAARLRIGMALGSMRPQLEGASIETYGGERNSNEVLVLANLGIGQIASGKYSPHQIAQCMQAVGAQALYCHLNVLQEHVQIGGDRNFTKAHEALELLIQQLGYPVIVKEVGSGIGESCARGLASLGVCAIETAAQGGTSFVRIEGMRAQLLGAQKAVYSARMLDNFGVNLADSVMACRRVLGPEGIVIASGGIQTAVQAVQCLRLGANLVAVARPVYRAYHSGGEDEVMAYLEALCETMALVNAMAT